MLALTRARTPTARVVRASVARLPLADASFPWAFSSYVLDLLPPEVIPLALAEVRLALGETEGARQALAAAASQAEDDQGPLGFRHALAQAACLAGGDPDRARAILEETGADASQRGWHCLASEAEQRRARLKEG